MSTIFLVMCFTADRLTDKENYTKNGDHDRIFDRMEFLLSAVFAFLFIRVDRTRDFSFCIVMQQYRMPVFGEFGQADEKFLVGLGGNKLHRLKTQA